MAARLAPVGAVVTPPPVPHLLGDTRPGDVPAQELKGTLPADLRTVLPQDTTIVTFHLLMMIKGATCLPGCAPGENPASRGALGDTNCFVPSGLFYANVDYGAGV
jgi:hypothetical protein